MKKMTFIGSLLTVFVMAFAPSSFAHEGETLLKAMGIIKQDNIFLEISEGTAMASGGIAILSVSLISETDGVVKKASSLAAKGARIGLSVTGVGLLVGIIVDIFDPSPAQAGTMTGWYMTPEGFLEFLELSEEHMLTFIEMEPRLGDMLIEVANAIEVAQQNPSLQ